MAVAVIKMDSPTNLIGDYTISRGGTNGDSNAFPGRILAIIQNTVVLIITLISIWLVQWVLDLLIGKTGRLFDYIPIRFITNFAYLMAFGKYMVFLVMEFKSPSSGGEK